MKMINIKKNLRKKAFNVNFRGFYARFDLEKAFDVISFSSREISSKKYFFHKGRKKK